ncbi:SMI1/KNR4 family protein [Sphaerisporangium sp. NPDC088356]|uniref:SMI1/KNR4 family protein n=1 Tax=Sphaerisporangium sp. NPDC088356 TaxID=3154871 RepID=UPI003436E4B9
MRRLITSRFVRLALAVTAVGAVIGAAVWARRSLPRRGGPPSPRNPVRDPALVLDREGRPVAEPEPAAPVLGRPSATDLKRYDRPEGGAAVARLLKGEPIRWRPSGRRARLAAALCGVVIAGQLFEQAVFGPSDQASAGDDFWSCGVICSLWTEGRTTGFDRRYADMAHEDPSQGSQLRELGSVYAGEWPQASGDPAFTQPATAPEQTVQPADPPRRDPPHGRSPESLPDPACTPATQAVVPRPVDPRVAKAVDHQWRRIEKWLKAHAPLTYAELSPPAKARTIAIAESQMGMRFPDSLRASLLRHDGARSADSGLLGRRTLGVREIRDAWRGLCVNSRYVATAPRSVPWNGRMIPFAVIAGGGHVVVDSRLGDAGESGRDGLSFGPQVRWTSYYALLKATAGSLETGRPTRGRRREVVGRRLRWNHG